MQRYKSTVKPELDMGERLGKIGKDDAPRGLKAESQMGEKGEGMLWIWVKCGGNSRWPVKDDFRRGSFGLGLAKKETSVSGVLLYICLYLTRKDLAIHRREVVPFWPDVLNRDII